MFSRSHLNPAGPRALVLCAVFVAGACGGEAGAPPVEVVEPQQYLDELPPYSEPPAAFDRATGGAKFEHAGDVACSTTTYEIGDAPKEVVMFNTDPQVFWPGALIQGDSYERGSPLLIPMPNRAPINISVQGLYAENASAFDVGPTQSEVNEAVSELLAGAVRDDIPSSQSVFFNQKEAYSFEQAALKLGFSARYLGTRVKGALNFKTNSEQNTVVANATIRTFTVSVDQPPTPSAFFDGLSADELQEQIDLGRMSENNLPVYVASVSYGQVMMFSATSTESMSKLKAALSARFSSFAGGASAGASTDQQNILTESEITVVTLGGSEEGVAEMIKTGSPEEFFRGTTVVTSSVPIAYTLKDLNGNVVKVGESTEYDLTTCQPQGFANFYVSSDRHGESIVAGFFADGTEADLGQEIRHYGPVRGIAHDSTHDLLFTLVEDEGTYVSVYDPSGGYSEEYGGWPVDHSSTSITFDPNHTRFYVTGDFGGGQVLQAYNPDGQQPVSRPDRVPFYSEIADPASYLAPIRVHSHAAAYDTTRDLIYVALTIIGECDAEDCRNAFELSTVVAFDYRGEEVLLEGGFDGLVEPRGVAYDPSHDRIYVSDASEDAVRVYDVEGRAITLPNPIENLSRPLGLHFDPTYNRLYVVNRGSSVITVHEPDGTAARGLTQSPFPELVAPEAIAFRPF